MHTTKIFEFANTKAVSHTLKRGASIDPTGGLYFTKLCLEMATLKNATKTKHSKKTKQNDPKRKK